MFYVVSGNKCLCAAVMVEMRIRLRSQRAVNFTCLSLRIKAIHLHWTEALALQTY